jgi:hypothetical protein
MSYREPFSKSFGGDFDRIDLTSHRDGQWLIIETRVGSDVERIRMELRSDEAVYDLHYALGRYLAHIEAVK